MDTTLKRLASDALLTMTSGWEGMDRRKGHIGGNNWSRAVDKAHRSLRRDRILAPDVGQELKVQETERYGIYD